MPDNSNYDTKLTTIANLSQYKNYKPTNQLKIAVIATVILLSVGTLAGILDGLGIIDILKLIG